MEPAARRACGQVALQRAQQRGHARAHAGQHAARQLLLLAKVDHGLRVRQAGQHLAAPGAQARALRAAGVRERLPCVRFCLKNLSQHTLQKNSLSITLKNIPYQISFVFYLRQSLRPLDIL